MRNNADYDWINTEPEYYRKNIDYVKEESRKVLESLEALNSSPPRDLK